MGEKLKYYPKPNLRPEIQVIVEAAFNDGKPLETLNPTLDYEQALVEFMDAKVLDPRRWWRRSESGWDKSAACASAINLSKQKRSARNQARLAEYFLSFCKEVRTKLPSVLDTLNYHIASPFTQEDVEGSAAGLSYLESHTFGNLVDIADQELAVDLFIAYMDGATRDPNTRTPKTEHTINFWQETRQRLIEMHVD